MAGGEGTRLRPLTCDIPKPMARLCGRPVLEYILDLLVDAGTSEAALTLRYLPQEIIGRFSDNSYRGMKLRFVEEEVPLGTAGGVRNAFSEIDEDLLIISGDALCDFDLKAAFKYHKQKGANATLLLSHVADPREYGLAVCSPSGRISGFVEKPGWAQAITDAVNTGIYIISPKALTLIPEGKPYDFAKDLFPQMLGTGMPLYGFEADGYWCDIGDIGAYTSCQFDMLSGRVGCRFEGQKKDGVIYKAGLPAGNYVLMPPVYIGSDVKIGDGSVIGPNAVIDDGCSIGSRTTVKDSVLLQDVFVGERCELRGALICRSASLKRGAGMFEGSVAGASAVIGLDASVSPGVRIWPGKMVEDGARAAVNIKFGGARRGLFDDEGIAGEIGVDLTPEICARIGAAAAGAFESARIGVACDGSSGGNMLKSAVLSGILSTGAQVCDFGSSFEAEFSFAMRTCALNLGLFIRTGGSRAVIKLQDKDGLTINRQTERKIDSSYTGGEIRRCTAAAIGEPYPMQGITALYRRELSSQTKERLGGLTVTVKSVNKRLQRILSETLTGLGANEGDENALRVHVSMAGDSLSLFDETGAYIDPARCLSLGCRIAFEAGEDVALPYDAPRAVEPLAKRYNKKVLRYLECPADDGDKAARSLAAQQPWVRDGLMSTVRILGYLSAKGVRLSEMQRSLPGFAVAVKAVRLDGNPGRLLRSFTANSDQLSEDRGPTEGVRLSVKGGEVLLSPLKRGGGLRIMAEASDMEAAGELCADIEKQLREHRPLDSL